MKRRVKPGFVRSVLSSILSPVAVALSGFMPGGYNLTDPLRKVTSKPIFANRSTANQLLNSSLSTLRTYCRHLERNNPTARAGVLALDALVIGSGIDLEPNTGNDATNAKVRALFNAWLRSVGTDGTDIYALQHMAMHECVIAGEWVWRIVPSTNTADPIPLRVLALEGEWLSELEAATVSNGCTLAAGVELDRYGNPTAYFLAPPEIGRPEKVAAISIIHGFEKKRSLQARGEPWFTPVIETLDPSALVIHAKNQVLAMIRQLARQLQKLLAVRIVTRKQDNACYAGVLQNSELFSGREMPDDIEYHSTLKAQARRSRITVALARSRSSLSAICARDMPLDRISWHRRSEKFSSGCPAVVFVTHTAFQVDGARMPVPIALPKASFAAKRLARNASPRLFCP